MSNSSVMVSIHCLVYNHEPFLRKCFEGFLSQKTNFPFEVIVHDDASTDNSAAIIRQYSEDYPNIFKPIFQAENQFVKSGFKSILRIVDSKLTGDYIAFCEGDDYWTDPLKLQKQVDLMESHPECSVCSTGFEFHVVDTGEVTDMTIYKGEYFVFDEHSWGGGGF